ncbi:DUF4329 domain-containing protein [Corallococcus sp. EGB]|uniref:DUF4329 domain-containing protein n=1 Tax=Corallococcus sp. EGB TaxID=1521117 RepID=UPI001CC0B430|nr:DUF4329 domain-containing protein [Corallococcus sp. EGB]
MLLGCAGGGPSRFWIDEERRLVVAGPMVGPFDSLMTLAPELCKAVRQMPGATAGNSREGQEYCGVIYPRNFESPFYASYPSTLGHPLPLPGGRKSCKPPERVADPDARTINIYADYHSHPAITGFSPEELQARTQRYYFRLMFNPACEVRLYDFQERTVFLLEDGQFIPVKRVTDDLRGQ